MVASELVIGSSAPSGWPSGRTTASASGTAVVVAIGRVRQGKDRLVQWSSVRTELVELFGAFGLPRRISPHRARDLEKLAGQVWRRPFSANSAYRTTRSRDDYTSSWSCAVLEFFVHPLTTRQKSVVALGSI